MNPREDAQTLIRPWAIEGADDVRARAPPDG